MKKFLTIAALSVAAIAVLGVVAMQYNSITQSPQIQEQEEGTRKVYQALCDLDKAKGRLNSDNCQRAQE